MLITKHPQHEKFPDKRNPAAPGHRADTSLYDNEVEQPAWFEEHFKEMHPDGNASQAPVKN